MGEASPARFRSKGVREGSPQSDGNLQGLCRPSPVRWSGRQLCRGIIDRPNSRKGLNQTFMRTSPAQKLKQVLWTRPRGGGAWKACAGLMLQDLQSGLWGPPEVLLGGEDRSELHRELPGQGKHLPSPHLSANRLSNCSCNRPAELELRRPEGQTEGGAPAQSSPCPTPSRSPLWHVN